VGLGKAVVQQASDDSEVAESWKLRAVHSPISHHRLSPKLRSSCTGMAPDRHDEGNHLKVVIERAEGAANDDVVSATLGTCPCVWRPRRDSTALGQVFSLQIDTWRLEGRRTFGPRFVPPDCAVPIANSQLLSRQKTKRVRSSRAARCASHRSESERLARSPGLANDEPQKRTRHS